METGHEPFLRKLKGRDSFHATHSMSSECCLSACAWPHADRSPRAYESRYHLLITRPIFGNADASLPRGFSEIHRLS